MNYAKHYGALIERAKARTTPLAYTEKHHIVPKCLGGSDDPSNLVRLTAEEHFVAHQLLVKIHPNVDKIVYAACLMSQSPHGKRFNNRQYSWLKAKLAKVQSINFSGKIWTQEQNLSRSEAVKRQWADPEFRAKRSAAMRGRKWSEESRAAKSEALKGKPGRVWTAEQKAKSSATKRNAFLQQTAERSRYD
jgi:hypothetical protein